MTFLESSSIISYANSFFIHVIIVLSDDRWITEDDEIFKYLNLLNLSIQGCPLIGYPPTIAYSVGTRSQQIFKTLTYLQDRHDR